VSSSKSKIMGITDHEQILGVLLRDGKTVYEGIRLNVEAERISVNERVTAVKRIITRMELSPMSALKVEDGNYTLRYTFDGQHYEESKRVQSGTLLSG
jgi:hypothetical protein